MEETIICISPLPIMIPVVKIVGNWCNLKCDYCFYYTNEQIEKTVMSEILLEKFIREYLDLFEGHIRFSWHGGEPLMAGMSFFEKIIEFQSKHRKNGHKILNTVQTNGTLINEKWARFFKRHNFRIGISLDGVEECHNQFRKNRKGEGVFDQVLKGVKILQEKRVPLGLLQVLTESNINKTKENLDFFVNVLGIKRIGNIIYRPSGNSLMEKQEITEEKLIEFYKTVIEFWLLQDNPKLQIREIENFVAGVIGKQASLCHFGGTCTAFFCLEHDGKIYPCDRLSGKPEFCFGDLSQSSLMEILNSKTRLEYAKKANRLTDDCLKCEWKNACHNGCPDYRNSNGKYYFCQAQKQTFNYLSEIFEDLRNFQEGKEVRNNGSGRKKSYEGSTSAIKREAQK